MLSAIGELAQDRAPRRLPGGGSYRGKIINHGDKGSRAVVGVY